MDIKDEEYYGLPKMSKGDLVVLNQKLLEMLLKDENDGEAKRQLAAVTQEIAKRFL